MIGSRRITLQFSVNWLVGISGAAIGLILVFIFAPDSWRPALIFTAAVLGGTGALVTAVNALDARAIAVEHAKMARAFDFIQRWNDPQFFYAKKNGREILAEFKKRLTVEAQKAYLQEDPTRLANLLDVLNVFEALSTAIQIRIADEQAAKRFFRSILLEYWHTTESFVKSRRTERLNPRMLQEMEWLFNQWKD